MITVLDHVVLLCPDIEAGVSTYETLLGTPPVWRAQSDGAATAVFSVANTALELMAPMGEGAAADKLREMTAKGARLTSLAYRASDISEAHLACSRRGLNPGEVTHGSSTDMTSRATRQWDRFRIPDTAMAGIKTFVLTPDVGADFPIHKSQSDTVSGLDHIVIQTPNPDRAVANYAGRLGLRLALDRTFPDLGARLLFFRVGDVTLEMMQQLAPEADQSGPDALWGLSWQVADIDAANRRLRDTGLDVSAVRAGRKPGTSVFSVRNGTLGLPTLFITHTPR